MKKNEALNEDNSLTYRLKTKNCQHHSFFIPKFEYVPSQHTHTNGFYNSVLRPSEMTVGNILKWVVKRKFTGHQWSEQKHLYAQDLPIKDENLHCSNWKIWFVNHATVLIQMGKYHFLTDPVWCDYVSPQQGLGPKRCRPAGLALEQLPHIDAVLLSHNHYDHMDVATLEWLHQKFQMPIYTGLANGSYLPTHFNVIEMDWWQALSFGENQEFKIIYVPAQHGSGRGLRDQNKALWGGFSIVSDAGHCYFAGDVAYSEHFKTIREKLGAPRLALLPIGAYEPRNLMRYVHMNPEEAVKAHLDLGARQSVAIHHRTFQLTDEAIEQPEQDLKIALLKYELTTEKFLCLEEGQTFRV